mgnify:CR=1 FL=1
MSLKEGFYESTLQLYDDRGLSRAAGGSGLRGLLRRQPADVSAALPAAVSRAGAVPAVSAPVPVAPVTEADISCGCGCSCAPGLVAALQLLCRPRFAALTDYQQFAFITRDFVLGSSLNCPAAATTPYDNLTGPLDGEFVKITPDSCENLEVSGQIYYPNPICTGGTETACCAEGPYFDADSVRLCGLSAVAFGVTETTDFPSAEAAYNELAKLFYQATHAGCGPMPSTPVKPTPCDRSTGDIAGRGTVSLTAGPLVLGNVSVLGEVGDVLILANSEDRLFYFVCRSTIGFIG